MRLVEPFQGHNQVAAGNATIGVDRDQALEVRRATEQLFDTHDDIALVEAVRRNGGGNRRKARDRSHRQSEGETVLMSVDRRVMRASVPKL